MLSRQMCILHYDTVVLSLKVGQNLKTLPIQIPAHCGPLLPLVPAMQIPVHSVFSGHVAETVSCSTGACSFAPFRSCSSSCYAGSSSWAHITGRVVFWTRAKFLYCMWLTISKHISHKLKSLQQLLHVFIFSD